MLVMLDEKSVGFIVWEPPIYVPDFMEILPIVVDTFHLKYGSGRGKVRE